MSLFLATFTAAASAFVAPPVEALDKVPEAQRATVTTYAEKHSLVGRVKVIDVDVLTTKTESGGEQSDVKVLLAEQAGSAGGCRYREHKITVEGYEDADGGSALTTSGEYASDCCALRNDFPCDRTGVDWVLHYDRARRAKDGKALGALAFKAFMWRASVSEDGEVHTKTRKYTVASLAKGEGLDLLPTIDPLRMEVSCGTPDEKGYFTCNAGQGGNYIRMEWRHVGDKTKRRFQTKLLKIVTEEH